MPLPLRLSVRINKRPQGTEPWPSLAQIAGHMLDAIFIDTLHMDLERLQRVNQTLASVRHDNGWRSSPELKAIDTLVIRPRANGCDCLFSRSGATTGHAPSRTPNRRTRHIDPPDFLELFAYSLKLGDLRY